MTEDNITISNLYIIQKIRQSLPIEDLLEWLIKEHPQAELKQILAMLNAIYQENFTILPVGEAPKTYQVGDRELTAFPQQIMDNG